MRRFEHGQRVTVKAVGEDERIKIPPTPGTVHRLRRADHGAWVMLDVLVDVPGVHPFPIDDPRAKTVLAYPEDCEARLMEERGDVG